MAKHCAKFGWPPLSDVGAVTKPRPETSWNSLGCPKLVNRSQPLIGRRLPYCDDIWRRYCCLTSCFDCRHVLVTKKQPDKAVRWCPDGEFLAFFCIQYFSASSVQHISDLHSKSALRQHHVWKYGRHPICGGGEQARKKKKKQRKKKPQDENIMACPIPQGGHNNSPNKVNCSVPCVCDYDF